MQNISLYIQGHLFCLPLIPCHLNYMALISTMVWRRIEVFNFSTFLVGQVRKFNFIKGIQNGNGFFGGPQIMPPPWLITVRAFLIKPPFNFFLFIQNMKSKMAIFFLSMVALSSLIALGFLLSAPGRHASPSIQPPSVLIETQKIKCLNSTLKSCIAKQNCLFWYSSWRHFAYI